ncbi:F-box protein At2g26160-like [Cornus florida]|uniref:F-box protein At2g26160-like n=1 Tax=Cornus florida TaxID=4283 RepID=UPI0028A0F76E|nr:F-box protein At2g26160-like [Cornus florida]
MGCCGVYKEVETVVGGGDGWYLVICCELGSGSLDWQWKLQLIAPVMVRYTIGLCSVWCSLQTMAICGNGEQKNMSVTLLNPFSGSTIGLPPIKDLPKFEEEEEEEDEVDRSDEPPFYEYLVYKAIWSADLALSPDDYIVTAIYDDRRCLAFFQSGDKAWTYIENKRFDLIFDVIYYKGQIFAVDYWGGVIRIDVNSRDGACKAPKVKIIAPRTKLFAEHTYLVESSSGDLLFVQRFMKEIGDDLQHETLGFKVFKLLELPHKKGYAKRIQVKSLGGDAMFLGDSHSTRISASKFPRCQPNSIYYTNDYCMFLAYPPYGRRDIGIFNVENGSFGTHYILDPSQRVTPPAIWIVPIVLGN